MIPTSPAAPSQASRPVGETELRSPIVEVHDLKKSYRTSHGSLDLFAGLDLEVARGELVAIVGQSGAGKSTLLHILGALDAPSAGTVYCASTNVAQLSPRQAAAFRNREIGYVWQFHYLLPEFTALENVAMPLLARGITETRGAGSGGKLAEGSRTWKTAATIGPASFPAASSSAWRWLGRWSTIPGCCWPTSLPATWTRLPPAASSI